MKNAVELFAALGSRLCGFGDDARTAAVAERACAANGWFTPADVRRAVRSIEVDMLCRGRLSEWLTHYPVPVAEPCNVLVVMAGNIPLVGFFDLLCVVASGHRCLVKTSAKDTVLMEYVVGLLRELEPAVAIDFYNGTHVVDAVIATGSDNANRYFRAQYAGIPALLRGSRQSVAVLSGRETPEQLRGLADDIWAYSGLGCRSVSLVFLPRGMKFDLQMPEVNEKYHNNYRQTRALRTMSGQPFVDFGASLAVQRCEFPTALSLINYSHYDTLAEVEQWLVEHDGELQCVVSKCVTHRRRTGFGCAQSPALTDYPDDCDVMEFLTSLKR